jgi:rubrerythrin
MRILPDNDEKPSLPQFGVTEPSVYYCPTCGYNEGNKIRCPKCGTALGAIPFKRTIIESLSGMGRREE